MPNCIHCGREMERRHLNPYLLAWECRMEHSTKPGCEAGRRWYEKNTYVVDGVRRHIREREVSDDCC